MCIPIGILWKCGHDWRAWWPCYRKPCPVIPAIIEQGDLPPKPTGEADPRFTSTQYYNDISAYRNYVKKFSTFLNANWCCGLECCQDSISRCCNTDDYKTHPEIFEASIRKHSEVCLIRFQAGFGLMNHMRRTDQPHSKSELLMNNGIDAIRYYLALRKFYVNNSQDRSVVATTDGNVPWTPPADLISRFKLVEERSGPDQAAQIYLDWNVEPIQEIVYILSALILDTTRNGKRKPKQVIPPSIMGGTPPGASLVTPWKHETSAEEALQTFDPIWLSSQPRKKQVDIVRRELFNVKKRMDDLSDLQIDLASDVVGGLDSLSNRRWLIETTERWMSELRNYCANQKQVSKNEHALLKHAFGEADSAITLRKAELDEQSQMLKEAEPSFPWGEDRETTRIQKEDSSDVPKARTGFRSKELSSSPAGRLQTAPPGRDQPGGIFGGPKRRPAPERTASGSSSDRMLRSTKPKRRHRDSSEQGRRDDVSAKGGRGGHA